MYINKGIYTYIPIPDPETPKPEPRWPDGPGSVKRTNNCSGCCPRQRECNGKIPGDRSSLDLLAWLSAPWYNKPEQFFDLIPAAKKNGEPNDKLAELVFPIVVGKGSYYEVSS